MLRHARAAFFVWGGIMALAGVGCFSSSNAASTILGIVLLLGGAGLIVGGVFYAKSVKKYNEKLLAEGETLSARCNYCGYEFTVRRAQFLPHRNFPEGYVYCPSCKKPLSFRLFTVNPNNSDTQ